MQTKINQHYVWEHYLKAWICNNQNEVWSSHNGKSRRRPISRIASADYFYELRPINEDELKFFKLFISRHPEDVQAGMGMLKHVDILQTPFRVKRALATTMILAAIKLGGYNNIPDEMLKEYEDITNNNETLSKNIVEDRHGSAEAKAVTWFDSLKKECFDFFLTDKPLKSADDYSTNEKYQFLLFVCMQHYRTKAVRERFATAMKTHLAYPEWQKVLADSQINKENVDIDNITPHLFRANELDCAERLWNSQASLTLLVNNTNLKFITSDHPAIVFPDTIFYYPISPSIAIKINSQGESSTVLVEEQDVNTYNQAIFDSSYQNVFSNRKDILEKYLIA